MGNRFVHLRLKHDAVLAAVKAWPGGSGGWRDGATAILDGACARRREDGKSGRRTVLRSNQELGLGRRGICSSNGLLLLPGRAAGHDGVDENEQLPGAGDQRALVPFAGGPQPLVKGDEVRIPEKGCRQRGCV